MNQFVRNVGFAAICAVFLAGSGVGAFAGYQHLDRRHQEAADLRKLVNGTTAGVTDLIDEDVDAASTITFAEFFARAQDQAVRLTQASIDARVAPLPEAEKVALTTYTKGLSKLVRLQESEARKTLALSSASDSLGDAMQDARSANYYTASIYIGAAQKSLAAVEEAEAEAAQARKDREAQAKALRGQLAKLRPALSRYQLISDGTLAKLEAQPEKKKELPSSATPPAAAAT